jgi:predicted DNA-binding helix-hairpin-helix protein
VHLKVLPGASRPAIEEAARLADRLSLNVEAPDASTLAALQTGKRWQEDILQRLRWLHELDRAGAVRSGISSQLLVGAGTASDRALATGSRSMRREFGLRRMHFGDFQPAPGTPLADQAAPDPRRRAHLYQWDWLATQYDFNDGELDSAFDPEGNLPLGLDPKLAVSLARPQERPTEVNSASYEELLRVPGIGVISARRIVDLRYLGALTDLQDLRALGVTTGRAAPFILLNGRRPPEAGAAMQRIRRQMRQALEPRPVQLALWPEDGWPTLSP